jgi:two-component system chemotaxis response regulator CheB
MAKSNKIRVFIVESSILDRDYLKKALAELPDIEILGASPNGALGLENVLQKKPEIVLLDINISDITAIQFTIRVLEKIANIGIILCTPHTPDPETIERTIITLESGAFDFIAKPEHHTEKEKIEILQRKLLPKIRGFSIKRYSQIAKSVSGHKPLVPIESRIDELPKISEKKEKMAQAFIHDATGIKVQKKVVVLGVSTGGPEALSKIIPLLPVDFSLPVIITIHMPKIFTFTLAKELDRKSRLKVVEAKAGEILQNSIVYIAQGGMHLVLVKKANGEICLDYSDDPPVNGCKPSVDLLFFSAAEHFQNSVIALILTGMGEDGVKGIGKLHELGALTIAQDEESSVIWGMPGSAVKGGFIDEIIHLDQIAARLVQLSNP